MCLCLEAGQCVQAAVLNSTCNRTREETVNPRGGRGMDVSLHFLCTPSWPPLWGGLPCGKLGINLHYSGHSKLLKSAGKNPPLVQWWGWGCRAQWQERWGAGGTWCESLGDGKGALSVGCAPGAGSSLEPWTEFCRRWFFGQGGWAGGCFSSGCVVGLEISSWQSPGNEAAKGINH